MAWMPLSKLLLPKALKCLLSGWIQPSGYLEKHVPKPHRADPSLGDDKLAKLWFSWSPRTRRVVPSSTPAPSKRYQKQRSSFFVTAADGAVLATGPTQAQETPGGSLGANTAPWRGEASRTPSFRFCRRQNLSKKNSLKFILIMYFKPAYPKYRINIRLFMRLGLLIQESDNDIYSQSRCEG